MALSRKDGGEDELFSNMLCVPAGGTYFQYGLKIGDVWYRNIDSYIKAGGSTGEQNITVSYLDYETTAPIEIRENPYERIEIVTEPTQKTYVYKSYASKISLSGLVFRAYKADGTYDTYTYGATGSDTAIEGWSRFLHSSLDNTSIGYLDVGTHTVYLTFMNMRTEYEIEVKEVTEEVFTDFKILKAPSRVVYYPEEEVNAWYECPDADGLELQVTNSDGNTKKYRVGYYPGVYDEEDTSGEYGSWNEISSRIKFDWKQINWSVPGNYPVTVSCQDMTDTFEITLVDSPVTSFEIVTMPEKNTYFRYEGNTVDLRGMSYKVTFDDGTVLADTLTTNDPKLTFYYKNVLYTIEKDWKKENSSNYPTYGENAIKFILFGQEYLTDTIMIKENPVESIEFVEEPEKMLYIGNDTDVDLYGAVLNISYVDGTTEKITVEEHTADVSVETYGKTLTASISYSWDESAEISRKCIRASYMNETAELLLEEIPFEECAQTLEDGGQAEGSLNADQPYAVFSFTPKETGSYAFYCVDQECSDMGTSIGNYYLELYENGSCFWNVSNDGWDQPFSSELTKGETYYYVVSLWNNYAENSRSFQCYLVSENSSKADKGNAVLSNLGASKTSWYDFEMEYLYLNLSGTTYQLTYDNGWTEKKYVTCSMPCMPIGEKELSVDWKYTTTNEYGGLDPEIREDNALVYTYGDETMEIPVQLNVDSPVESIEINNNPYENCYLYQYQQGMCSICGLSVTIHYSNGREDETIVWDDDMEIPQLDGYPFEVNFSVISDTEQEDASYLLEVSYMGVSAKKEITFQASPITNFELVKKPEKNGFYAFEKKGTPDLYGMEFLVTYKNGSTQTVQVTDHTNSISVSDEYTGKLRGSIQSVTKTDDSGNGQTVYVLELNYLGYSQQIMEYENLPLPVEDAIQIQPGNQKYIVLEDDVPYAMFVITSEMDNQYCFKSNGKLSQRMYRYNAAGECVATKYSSSGNTCEMSWNIAADETNYIVILKNETGNIGSLLCTLEGEEIEKEEIDALELSINNPVAEETFPLVKQLTVTEFDVDSHQWYGDADADGCADFATAHRLKLVLAPLMEYCFTESTKITLNGMEITTKSLASDGKITLYYTFPYTECKVQVPEIEGYTLDLGEMEKTDRVAYGGTYKFRYIDANGAVPTDLVVKSNGNLLEADEDGYYVLTNVSENITILVKSSNVEVDETESKVSLHNQSEEIYDVLVGQKNQSISENTNGENTLPVLPSYVNGSELFFYGWYTGKDADWNGMDTRFTSKTKLLQDSYDLYAKWGSGFFSSIHNGKQVNYQVLSFDEENKMTVQIRSVASPSTIDEETENIDSTGASEDVLVIPESITSEQLSLQEDLDIDIASCKVIGIGAEAFRGCRDLTIALPDTITEIDSTAFLETENITLLCSRKLANSDVILEIQDTGVTIQIAADDLSSKNENGANRYVVEIQGNHTYTGQAICPSVLVRENQENGILLNGSDYEITYSDNTNAGTAQVTITGQGNYTGSITQSFVIGKAAQVVTASDLVKTTENLIFPLGAKTNGDGKLTYTSSNLNVATVDNYGIAQIKGVGVTTISIQASETNNYKASEVKTITLTVNPLQTSGTDTSSENGGLSLKTTTYTKAYGSKPFYLKATANTAITYASSNTKVATVTGTGKVTVKKCGKAIITVRTQNEVKNVTVKVVPKQAKINVKSKKAGQLTVSWKNQKEAAGYVVEYSTDKKFKKKVNQKVISSNKTTQITLKKLSKGKKYYVRVKAYTKMNKKKVYGEVSKTATKKVKK